MLENRPEILWPAGSVGVTDKGAERKRQRKQRQTKEDKKGGHRVSKQFYRERTQAIEGTRCSLGHFQNLEFMQLKRC